MTADQANIQTRIHELTTQIGAIQERLEELASKPGERPDLDTQEAKAELRMERERLTHDRSQLLQRRSQLVRESTRTLRFVLADGDPDTYLQAYQPIYQLLAKLRDDGVIVDWEWVRSR